MNNNPLLCDNANGFWDIGQIAGRTEDLRNIIEGIAYNITDFISNRFYALNNKFLFKRLINNLKTLKLNWAT